MKKSATLFNVAKNYIGDGFFKWGLTERQSREGKTCMNQIEFV